MFIVVISRELKEAEVRNSHSLQLNSEEFFVLFILYVCLYRRGSWDVAESQIRRFYYALILWNEVFISRAQVIQTYMSWKFRKYFWVFMGIFPITYAACPYFSSGSQETQQLVIFNNNFSKGANITEQIKGF